jgi:hypothetical protein
VAEVLKLDGAKVSPEFGEKAVDGGEWRGRGRYVAASQGRTRTSQRNLGLEGEARSAMRSCGRLPESIGATMNGGGES